MYSKKNDRLPLPYTLPGFVANNLKNLQNQIDKIVNKIIIDQ